MEHVNATACKQGIFYICIFLFFIFDQNNAQQYGAYGA